MARAAEDAAFGKATSHQLKSFLLALTAGGYIALGFVFFVTSQVGAQELPYGVAKTLGGLVFSHGLALVERKSVVKGKSGSVRVALGGSRISKTKKRSRSIPHS